MSDSPVEKEYDIMRCELIGIDSSWREVANSARTTIGLDRSDKKVSNRWKQRMMLCEHSPIRKMRVNWVWYDIPYWVSVHFVRHKFGIEHFVSTQRTDRTGVNRDDKSQNALVRHECIANLQAIINISRKRLCYQASEETRQAWMLFLNELKKVDPVIYNACVPECIYRGYCYEYETCNYYKSEEYKKRLDRHKELIVR